MTKKNQRLRIERLAELARIVLTIPRFDMDHWGYHPKLHRPTIKNYCGTAFCALGAAAVTPKFRRLGLKLVWAKDEYKEWRAEPTFGRTIGLQAGAQFFKLSPPEARSLFLPSSYASELEVVVTRQDVIKRISELIEAVR